VSSPDSGSGSSDSGSISPDSGGASGDSGASSLGSAIAAMAMANVGLGACSKNSEGGTAYETSCDGNGGQPEYWCADFAQWVWQEAGANTDGLDAAASTFYIYGQTYGTLHTKPSIGDAVVFNYMDDYAEHVALVVAIDSDGSIETVSGDWNGTGSTEAAFSSTSQVVLNVPAYPGVTGSAPDTMGMTLSAFVSPVPKGSGTTASGAPQCIAGSGQQGTCIDTSTCASTGGTSTAGYCPGPDSEECCTGT
jgi:hypothetical protein